MWKTYKTVTFLESHICEFENKCADQERREIFRTGSYLLFCTVYFLFLLLSM